VRRPTFVLDHDFPDPPGMDLERLIPSVELKRLRTLHPDLVQDHDDWEVLQKLKARGGVDGFITLDADMLELPREMVVLHQTRLTLIVIENTDNDPIAAWAMLLIHGPHLARQLNRRKPQLWELRCPPRTSPRNPHERVEVLAARLKSSPRDVTRQFRLSPQELDAK
jgi:hypothetical protein